MDKRSIKLNSGQSTAAAEKDSSQRTRLIVLIGVTTVGALLVGRTYLPAFTSAAPPTPVVVSNDSATASAPTIERPQMVWPSSVARDPFESEQVFPPPPKQPAPVEIAVTAPQSKLQDVDALVRAARNTVVVQGTITGQRPVAIINGNLYRLGESVGGFRIMAIETRHIVVETDGVKLLIPVTE